MGKGLSKLMVLFFLTIIIAAAVALVVFGNAKAIEDKPDQAEKAHCETACVAEEISGIPNEYGCDCTGGG